MIDASHETFEENIAITKRVVDRAHAKSISVEAELGMLGGVEEDIAVDEGHACLTNPDEAVEFVKRSGCDSLAAAIGTSGGGGALAVDGREGDDGAAQRFFPWRGGAGGSRMVWRWAQSGVVAVVQGGGVPWRCTTGSGLAPFGRKGRCCCAHGFHACCTSRALPWWSTRSPPPRRYSLSCG
jgi:hypothetical protein